VYVGLLNDESLIYVVETPDEMTGGLLLDPALVGGVPGAGTAFGVEDVDGSRGCDMELTFAEMGSPIV